jgi:hypothetical protein
MEVTCDAPFAATASFSRRESLAHDFAHAPMHIQSLGNDAPASAADYLKSDISVAFRQHLSGK